MGNINGQDYIDELLFNIKQRDSVKARYLLQHIGGVDETVRRRLVFELGRTEDDYSLPLLASLVADKPDLVTQFPGLKQILITKFLDNPSALIGYIRNPAQKQREFFIEIAGMIHLDEVMPDLVKILDEERTPSVLVATLQTIGDIGEASASNAVSEHLYSTDTAIVDAAIYALKKIAGSFSVQRLASRIGSADVETAMKILDALAEIQTPEAIEKLNETLVSHYAALRNFGKQKLVQLGAKSVPTLIDNLKQDDPDLLIHTLNVIGEIGDKSALVPVRKLIYSEPQDPNVRFAAYEALGLLPLDKNCYVLAEGLADPVENVSMAAAKAINRNYNDVLSAGIRNLFHDSSMDKQKILSIVIDSESDNIFLDLLEDGIFRKLAQAYIKNKAHKDIRKHFTELCRKKDVKDILEFLESGEAAAEKKSVKLNICVVDDSKMILNVYKSILHKLEYNSDLFEKPADALKFMETKKPDLVLTDLNMPEITGIELTARLRKIYPPAKLPIIMVTTQNEVQDNEAATKAGVNLIIHKPFTAESIEAAIASVRGKGIE